MSEVERYAVWAKTVEGEDLAVKYGGKPYYTISLINPSLSGDEPERLDGLWSCRAGDHCSSDLEGWTGSGEQDLLTLYGTASFETISVTIPCVPSLTAKLTDLWHRPVVEGEARHGG